MPPKGKGFKQHPLANKGGKSNSKKSKADADDALLDQAFAATEALRQQEPMRPAEGAASQNDPRAMIQAQQMAARERVLYAAANKCFKVSVLPDSFNPESKSQGLGVPCRKQTSQEPTEEHREAAVVLKNDEIGSWGSQVKPGSLLEVEWFDPRPDEGVWQPAAGPKTGRCVPFAYWDGPSLALELHTITMEVEPDDDKVIFGSLLGGAATGNSEADGAETEGASWVLWNVAFHVHATGKAFPSPSDKFSQAGIVYQEICRMTSDLWDREGEAKALPALWRIQQLPICGGRTELISVRPDTLKQGMGTETVWLALQEYARFYLEGFFEGGAAPEGKKADCELYPWHAAQEQFWGGLFTRYINEGIAPCMFTRDYCYRGALCQADHRRTGPAFEDLKDLFYDDIADPVVTTANHVSPVDNRDPRDLMKLLNDVYPDGGAAEFNVKMKIPSLRIRGLIAQVTKRVLRAEAESNNNRDLSKLKGGELRVVSHLVPGAKPKVEVQTNPSFPKSKQFDHIVRVTSQSCQNPDVLESFPQVTGPVALIFSYRLNIASATQKLPPKPKSTPSSSLDAWAAQQGITQMVKGPTGSDGRQQVMMVRGANVTNVEPVTDADGNQVGVTSTINLTKR